MTTNQTPAETVKPMVGNIYRTRARYISFLTNELMSYYTDDGRGWCRVTDKPVENWDLIELIAVAVPVQELAQLRRAQAALPKWIPCSERMPAWGSPVMAIVLCGSDKVPSFAILKPLECSGACNRGITYWREQWPDPDSSYSSEDVTAWQPLPPAPNKGEI